jgi:hypothetical protein
VFHSRDVWIYMCAFSDVFRLILPVLRVADQDLGSEGLFDPESGISFFRIPKTNTLILCQLAQIFPEHVQNKIFQICKNYD